MNKLQKIIILFFVLLPFCALAQNLSSLSHDFYYEDCKVENEGDFVLYQSNNSFSASAFSEVSSTLLTLNAAERLVMVYELKDLGENAVRVKRIPIPFVADIRGEGISCSPDGRYFAVLEVNMPGVLHVFDVATGKEVGNASLNRKISTSVSNNVCHFNFISNHQILVAGNKCAQSYDLKTKKLKKSGIKLAAVNAVTSLGQISGYVVSKKQKYDMVYDSSKKKYFAGQAKDYGNHVMIYDKKKLERNYIRIVNKQKTSFRTDRFNEFAISGNELFPTQQGQPAIKFQDRICLGWVNNEQFLILENSSKDGFVVVNYERIGLEYEKQYVRSALRDYDDTKVSMFLETHPRSIYRQMALDGLVQMYANDPQKRYSFTRIRQAFKKYPEMKSKIERILADYVRNNDDAITFVDDYPKSKLKRLALGNAFRDGLLGPGDIQELRSNFGSDFVLTKFDPIKFAPDDQKANYLRSMFNYSGVQNLQQMETFYLKYQWLTYNEKGNDVVEHVWNYELANPAIDGGYILYMVEHLPQNKTYKSWGVTKPMVDEFVKQKLQAEASKIRVVFHETLDNHSEQWEEWLNSKYTAGMVSMKDNQQYVIYGEVCNESRFPMPVVVQASSNLMSKLQAQGGVVGMVGTFLEAVGVKVSAQEQSKGYRSEKFYIPYMKPNTTSAFAILLDFGSVSAMGFNPNDRLKIYQNLYLAGTNVSAAYGDPNVSESILRKQDQWQKFAKNGLPNTKLTDLWRGRKVDEQEWQRKWADEQERLRIREENTIRVYHYYN